MRLGLRTKLILMLVSVTAFALGIACTAFVVNDRQTSGRAKQATMTVLADTVAGSVAGALAFGDEQSARFVLAKLAAEETALAAAAYDQQGKRLAEWTRDAAQSQPTTLNAPATAPADALIIERPVASEGNPIGTMRLVVSTEDLQARTRRFLWIALAIFLGAVLIAAGAALRMHRIVSDPVNELGSVAARVQETRDYALRARALSNDELGRLTDAFNHMLESIQHRDAELEQHRSNLAHLVDQRTAQLAHRNREMRLVFDTVEQGFVTIDAAGLMANERSARFDEWFGAPPEGRSFAAHLDARVPGFGAQFGIAWDQVVEQLLPLEVAIDMLPARFELEGRHYALRGTPIVEDEQLRGALLAISDVTAAVEAERRQREERELIDSVTRLISDKAGFLDFLDEGSKLVDAIGHERGAVLARALHTLKGTCSLYGVQTVAALCHQLEDELERGEPVDAFHQRLHLAWRRYSARLEPFLDSNRGAVTVSREALSQLAAHLAGAEANTVKRWLLDPVEPRLTLLATRARQLAQQLGKGPLSVDVQAGDVRVDRAAFAPLWNTVVHLVRNAIDHGLETPDERRAVGKPEHPTLRLTARHDASHTVLEFSDDGRGIDWARVAARAGRPDAPRAELEAVLFSDGFSTRDAATETSGRGVGLSAVAEAVHGLQGRIEIDSEPGRGTTFRLRIPTLEPLAQAA